MKNNNIFFLAALLVAVVTLPFSFVPAQQIAGGAESASFWSSPLAAPAKPANQGFVNLSISHGHCSLPMKAELASVISRSAGSSPQDLQIDFQVNANSLVANGDRDDEWTHKMRAAAAFNVEKHPDMRFVCQGTRSLGPDQFLLNGMITIKGKTLPASFVATPIYDGFSCGRTLREIVLDGQVNLKDFDVWEGNVGGPDDVERRMFINLVVNAKAGC